MSDPQVGSADLLPPLSFASCAFAIVLPSAEEVMVNWRGYRSCAATGYILRRVDPAFSAYNVSRCGLILQMRGTRNERGPPIPPNQRGKNGTHHVRYHDILVFGGFLGSAPALPSRCGNSKTKEYV